MIPPFVVVESKDACRPQVQPERFSPKLLRPAADKSRFNGMRSRANSSNRLPSAETVNQLRDIQDRLVKRVSNAIDDEIDRLRISELCGERPETIFGTTQDVNALNESFKDAVKLADRQYAGELLDAEMFSSGEAMDRVRQVSECERATVVQEEFARWRDRSVEAIRAWAPRYFTIARRFPEQISQVSSSQWTKGKLFEGVNRRLRPAQLGAVTFWLKAACGERDRDSESVVSPTPWRMPAWAVTRQAAPDKVIKAATSPRTAQLRGRALSYPRSPVKRAIALRLTQKPAATDRQLCDWLDEECTELPRAWNRNGDRSFTSAYGDPERKHNIESMINKVRRDMRTRGLL